MLAVCDEYERLTGIPKRMERVYWWPTREWLAYTVEISLGKQDGVRHAEPDAAIAPERMPGDSARAEGARKTAAIMRQTTDLAVLQCLREHGPQTRGQIAARTGKVDDTVTESLRRRPDLFESDGRNYNRTWWAKERE